MFDDVVFIDDYVESVMPSVSEDDLFAFKVKAMNSDFSYLFDVDYDGTMHTLDHLTSIFDIHSIDSHTININTNENEDDPRPVSVSSNTTLEERERFEKILKKHREAFAFTYEDMPGIDRNIVEHRIPIIPGMKPVKQKLRRLRPEWSEKVRE